MHATHYTRDLLASYVEMAEYTDTYAIARAHYNY